MKGGIHFYRGSGKGAARYFSEGHQGAEDYYSETQSASVTITTLCAGEQIESRTAAPGDLAAWVEGIDETTGETKGWIRSSGVDREPLRFVEVVVNNPKSLSVVASQNPVVAEALDAVLARQATEIARYLSAIAVTRVGPRGTQREVGNLVTETAMVSHLTSREGDPHRHVHLMMNTRVKTEDGSWHGLHSAAIRQHIAAINQCGSRILLTDPRLVSALAGEGYTLGRDGEIDQARGAVDLMSKRSAQVRANRSRIEAEWREAHPTREPSQRVRNGWDREAWALGRKEKSRAREHPAEMSERVRAELAEAGFDFTLGARAPLLARAGIAPGQVDRDWVADEAIATLSAQQSAWSKADLIAEVEAIVAGTGVLGDDQAVTELAEDCRTRAIARCLSVLDPEVSAPTVMSRHLTSARVVDADMALNLGLAGLAGSPRPESPDLGVRALATAKGLDDGQIEAVAAIVGPSRLEVIIGPAGTGKTSMLSAAKHHLETEGRTMVLVAPTRKAAQVAAAEVGGTAASLSKLVYEHGFRWDTAGRWSRLAPGDEDPVTGYTYEGPGEASVLSGQSVVVVDEAGLITVDQANALIDVIAESNAALRLIGDPRQLGAVGRGGVMETAARWVGSEVTLDQVHRFLRIGTDETGLPITETDPDYGALSLLLREGTEPDEVIGRLVERGSVILHESEADAVEALAAEIAAVAGRDEALAVTVATNAQAGDLNRAVHDLRVATGAVEVTTTAIGMGGVTMGVGDRIVTRKNDTARGVANRESWTITAITDDGAVLAKNRDRHVRLEPDYLVDAVQLGYATTDYGNQGVTCERSVTWVSAMTTSGGLYVGATRGRYDNTIHVVANDLDDARGTLIAAIGRDRADRGLDAARAVAEEQATQLARHTSAQEATPIDPATWRIEAELAVAARRIEADLEAQLARLPWVPKPLADAAENERLNRVDHEAALSLHREADRCRTDAAEVEACRGEGIVMATDDFFAVREAARVIRAGPGWFGRKTRDVEAAQKTVHELGRKWLAGPDRLPWPDHTDEQVRQLAVSAADRRISYVVDPLERDARRYDHLAEEREREIAFRSAHEEAVRRRTEARDLQRSEAELAADRRRAEVEREREIRDQMTAEMSPEAVAEADQARVDFLIERGVELSERKIAARSLYVSGPGDGRSVLGPDFDDPNMEFDLGRDYGPGIEF